MLLIPGEWQPHKFIVISDWGYIYDVFFNGKDCLLVGCDQALVYVVQFTRFYYDAYSKRFAIEPLGCGDFCVIQCRFIP